MSTSSTVLNVYGLLHSLYDFYFNRIDHKVTYLGNSDTCENMPSSSDLVLNIQFIWISSDFITRVVKVCRNLLEAATQITNLEQVIDRLVKIFDALLYAQGEESFNPCVRTPNLCTKKQLSV